MATLAALAATFAVTAATLWGLRRSRLARALQDLPNDRSLHTVPVPRIGGMGLLAGMATFALLGPPLPAVLIGLLAGWAALALLSSLDDRRSLPITVRLPAHLGVATTWLLGVGLPHGLVATPSGAAVAVALVLGLTWCLNLYNFMDGADGLAGGMAVIGFGICAVGAAQAGDLTLASLCAAIATAAAAFLLFNFAPASLFLGDAGSIPLGFAAGAVCIHGAIQGLWPPAFGLAAFFPFAFDATFTLARRAWRGQKVWQAHREHLYQRIALSGVGHRRLAWMAYAAMSACGAAALTVQARPDAAALIIVALLAAGAIVVAVVARLSVPTRPLA